MVWPVWFGLVNGYDLTRPLVHLKVVMASLELNLVTIPGRVGPGRSNIDNKAMLSLAGTGAWQHLQHYFS